jgi:acyl-ACP thioesterase
MIERKETDFLAQYIVRTNEIDHHKRIKVSSLLEIMWEASMQHVFELNVSVWDLEKEHLAWALRRLHLEIKSFPVLGQGISVHTYPSMHENVFTYRDYYVFDKDENVLARASTQWFLFNTLERKMVRIPPSMLQFNLPDSSKVLPKPTGMLRPLENVQYEKEFKVRLHDLDFNKHLNNVAYVEWILETIPDQRMDKEILRKLDIQFKAEALLGEKVLSQSEVSETTCTHRILHKTEGKTLALGSTFWESRK